MRLKEILKLHPTPVPKHKPLITNPYFPCIFKINPVPTAISTVQSMEPSKPKAPPFIRLASGSRRASKPLQNLFPLTS